MSKNLHDTDTYPCLDLKTHFFIFLYNLMFISDFILIILR